MRPRTEAALALGLLVALGALVTAVNLRKQRPEELDPRASTYLPGPAGAKALSDALERLEVEVTRLRTPARPHPGTGEPAGRLLMVLDPGRPYSPYEARHLLEWYASPDGGDLLLAGDGSATVMRCFGYQPDPRERDSVEVRAPGTWPRLGAVLATSDEEVVDSSGMADTGLWRCTAPTFTRVDTLLTSSGGRALALRLVQETPARNILLLADASLFRNRALRETEAGPWALGLVVGHYDQVLVDEAHQGFGGGGSLARATLDWSFRSPFGWAAWQLALAGVLLLLAGAIRFGPVRSVISRRRRSPLEHVRALATALAAAKGHDVAIGAVVRGLRRRLMPAGQRGRTDWREWVERLSQNVRSPRAREAAATLQSLTRPGQPPEGVLRAANAVEDVWEELRP